jgi:hypothetical protein
MDGLAINQPTPIKERAENTRQSCTGTTDHRVNIWFTNGTTTKSVKNADTFSWALG